MKPTATVSHDHPRAGDRTARSPTPPTSRCSNGRRAAQTSNDEPDEAVAGSSLFAAWASNHGLEEEALDESGEFTELGEPGERGEQGD